jgi:hypothetical protein
MPLEIAEDLVSLAYQSLGYFVSEGRRLGYNREIDLLVIRPAFGGDAEERLHVEVQLGTDPILPLSVERILSKYTHPTVVAELAAIFGGLPYRRLLVHGAMAQPGQLEVFRSSGIECVHAKDLIQRALAEGKVNRLHRLMAICRMLLE